MIYAGIDIAKSDHVVGAVDDGGGQVAKPMPFKNSKDGFEKCVAWLEGVAESPSDAAAAMEATGRYRMACLAYPTARGCSVSVVDPVHVKAVRKLKDMIGVKNDRVDSRLIAETLGLGECDQTRLATGEVQSPRTLTRYRLALAQEIGTVKTRAVCLMDAYFPEYAGLFPDMFGAASRALLSRSPQPCLKKGKGSPEAVVAWLDATEAEPGLPKAFRAVFPVLLVDRGVEFDD